MELRIYFSVKQNLLNVVNEVAPSGIEQRKFIRWMNQLELDRRLSQEELIRRWVEGLLKGINGEWPEEPSA